MPRARQETITFVEASLGAGSHARKYDFSSPEPWRGAPAAHATLEIAWIDRGSAVYVLEGVTHEVTAGQVIVVPAGAEHVTELRPGTQAGSAHLAMSTVAELEEAVGGRSTPEVGLLTDPTKVCTLARWILAESCGRAPGRHLAVDAMVEALLIEVIRAAPPARETTSRDPRVRKAIELIEARYADTLSIDEMAAAARMSRFHFSRRFREVTGKSPYQFLIATRVARAKEILRSKKGGVTEAALEVGFHDLGRFAAAFRREVGCAPSAFVEAA